MRLIIAVLVCLGVFSEALAQDNLVVATRHVKPFVFEENGQLTGFSVELWQEIRRQLKAKSTFVVTPTVKELLDTVKAQKAQLGIAAISVTAEREQELDFSQPMFDSGLQILVPAQGSQVGAVLRSIVATLFSPTVLPYIGVGLLLLLVLAHIVWLLERRPVGGFLEHKSYLRGLAESLWWVAACLGAQAENMPKSAVARFIAVLWIFAGAIFLAFFTAAMTSNLTVQAMRSGINGPDDLPGKRVATVKGSTSMEYLNGRNISAREYTNIDEALSALTSDQADAVVYDAPVLLYYASHEGNGKAQVVGAVFRKESYGIAFPDKSPLRKRVNEALLKIKEIGTYDKLYTKWFGGNGS